jgi:hypothetical protein
MFDDLKLLEKASKGGHSGNWRTGPTFFTSIPGGLKAGVVNLSPAWFEQGHQVHVRRRLSVTQKTDHA